MSSPLFSLVKSSSFPLNTLVCRIVEWGNGILAGPYLFGTVNKCVNLRTGLLCYIDSGVSSLGRRTHVDATLMPDPGNLWLDMT